MQSAVQSITVSQVREAIVRAEWFRNDPAYRSAIAARVIDGVRVVDCPFTDGGKVYDWAMCEEGLGDGDVFVFASGACTGIMIEAWPTLVAGDAAQLHRLEGYTWETFESGKYAAAAAVAQRMIGA